MSFTGYMKGPDNEDARILQTVIEGIPIINTYVPQGHSIRSEKYAFKLKWFAQVRRYFETHLDPQTSGDMARRHECSA